MNATIPLSPLVASPTPSAKEHLDRWFSFLYPKLIRSARYMIHREAVHPTLDSGMLVHETYERLVGYANADWHGAEHVFCTARRVMNHVLLDWVRRHQCDKRGGAEEPVSLHRVPVGQTPTLEDCLSVRQALRFLNVVGERAASVVEYKMYGELTDGEIADELGVSVRTVRRDWVQAQTVLRTVLDEPES
jgi:RNA polymerase sigma factor (TIGR02999 family)